MNGFFYMIHGTPVHFYPYKTVLTLISLGAKTKITYPSSLLTELNNHKVYASFKCIFFMKKFLWQISEENKSNLFKGLTRN